MPASTYERDGRLNRYRGTASPAVPASHFVSLHTGDPGTTGASECANANSYARVEVSSAAGSWDAPATDGSTRCIDNTAAITFPTASGSWGTVTHFGIWDSGTYGAGNFIRGGALTASQAVGAGNIPQFAANNLSLKET